MTLFIQFRIHTGPSQLFLTHNTKNVCYHSIQIAYLYRRSYVLIAFQNEINFYVRRPITIIRQLPARYDAVRSSDEQSLSYNLCIGILALALIPTYLMSHIC